MKLIVPAIRAQGTIAAVPQATITIGDTVVCKLLCDRYRRYVKTRDFSWFVKLQVMLHRQPLMLHVLHAISNEAWAFEMGQGSGRDMIHLSSITNNMLSQKLDETLGPIWYARQIALVEPLQTLITEPGFDMKRLKDTGMVLMQQRQEEGKESKQQTQTHKEGRDGDDDALSPSTAWEMPQDGEEKPEFRGTVHASVYSATTADTLAAAQSLAQEETIERLERKRHQNRLKRLRKKAAAAASASVSQDADLEPGGEA